MSFTAPQNRFAYLDIAPCSSRISSQTRPCDASRCYHAPSNVWALWPASGSLGSCALVDARDALMLARFRCAVVPVAAAVARTDLLRTVSRRHHIHTHQG